MQPTDHEIISVGDFTRRVKTLLEGELVPGWVRGEVSNLRRQSSGHVYFTLKDRESQLSCALFRGDAMRQRLALRDGMQVVVYGEISVYEPRGSYQYICRFVLEDGMGHLQVAFERLKAKLQAEGLFDKERKLSLPKLPQTVGFVTSPTGAAIRDFLSILQRRAWRGRIVILPARVQGAGAAAEMVNSIRTAEELDIFDLIVIGRGGGSLEDLWCFNEEPVARAIAACKIPIISAVGHEIDIALSDFVADVRAETPSAAAELVSSGFLEVRQCAIDLAHRLVSAMAAELQELRRTATLVASRLGAQSPRHQIEQAYLRTDDLGNRLNAHYRSWLSSARMDFMALSHRLATTSPARQLEIAMQRLAHLSNNYHKLLEKAGQNESHSLVYLEKRLKGSSLHDILRRGFVIVRDEKGNIVTRKLEVEPGQRLSTIFLDGEIVVEVKNGTDITSS